jgi:Tfp pilus assembly protein PilP
MDRVDDMAMRAGNYFGQNSGRLIRQRTGEVEIGDLQVIESNAAPPDDDN